MASCSEYLISNGVAYFVAVSFMIVALLIAVFNVMVILTVLKDPCQKLQRPFNFLLLNLLSANVLCGAVLVPILVAKFIKELNAERHEIDQHSKVVNLIYLMTCMACSLSICVLFLDRYEIAVFTVRYRRKMTRGKCIFLSVSIWLLSIAIPVLYYTLTSINYFILSFHAAILFSCTIFSFTYFQIHRRFKQKLSQVRTFSEYTTDNPEFEWNEREKQVMHAYRIILILFTCIYMIIVILDYVSEFCSTCSCSSRYALEVIKFFILCANSVINPFLTIMTIKMYRQAVWKLLRCKTLGTDRRTTYQG